MKVTISAPGRFHLFYLAAELEKRGFLHQLITSYPKFEVEKYGIPGQKTDSIILKEIMQRGWEKLPEFVHRLYNPEHFFHSFYDRISASKLKNGVEIAVSYPEFFRHTLAKAKNEGAVTVVENVNTHELFATSIIKEEYERCGVKRSSLYQISPPACTAEMLYAYEHADFISIPSLFVKKTFIEQGIPEEKLIHIPYGVNLSEFSQSLKKDDVFRVIYVGGMTLRKGVRYLLQAFAELNLPNAELVFVGTQTEEIKPFFQKYKGKFKWFDSVPQCELSSFYSQSSVFVMMSIEEGLAMVMPQAMACGLPVICTTNTGGVDIVRDGMDGFVIPIRGVEALKEKLGYLYDNQDVAHSMGQSAKKRVSEGFTWGDYGRKMITEYERILSR